MAQLPVYKLPTNPQLGLVSDETCIVVGPLVYEPPIVVVGQGRLLQGNEIGLLTYINRFSSLLKTTVGRHCSIAEGVALGPGEHPMDRVSTHPFVYNSHGERNEPALFEFEMYDFYQQIVDRENVFAISDIPRTVVGNDVWIGRNVTVRQGVKIGNGAVIGAGSVVTKDVEPYTVVAGVPAKVIRKRFDEATIARFETLQWWRYDLRPIRQRLDYRDVRGFLEIVSRAVDRGEVQELRDRFVLNQVDGKIQVTKS